MNNSKRDKLWAEAKKKCRLNTETVHMAKEMGLNPRWARYDLRGPKTGPMIS